VGCPRQRVKSRPSRFTFQLHRFHLPDEPVSIKLRCVYYSLDNILRVACAFVAINRTSSQTAETSEPSTRSYRPRSHSRTLRPIRLNLPKGLEDSSRPQSIGLSLIINETKKWRAVCLARVRTGKSLSWCFDHGCFGQVLREV